MKNKNKPKELKRQDALSILSILYAYTKRMDVSSSCSLALQIEKRLSNKKERNQAIKKTMLFFSSIPKEFSDLYEEDSKYTILNFALALSDYLSKYRGESVYGFSNISSRIKKNIDYNAGYLDKSSELLSILGIK